MTASPNNKNRYAGIHTAAALDAAIKRAQTERKKMDQRIGRELHGLQKNLRPAQLLAGTLRQVAPYLAWSELGLLCVRGLRRLLGGPGRKR